MLKLRKMLLGAFRFTFRFINDNLAHGLKRISGERCSAALWATICGLLHQLPTVGSLPHTV